VIVFATKPGEMRLCCEIRDENLFPKGLYPLPHPNHAEGEMVFSKFEITKSHAQPPVKRAGPLSVGEGDEAVCLRHRPVDPGASACCRKTVKRHSRAPMDSCPGNWIESSIAEGFRTVCKNYETKFGP
jgi:hypothetical protein